MTSAKSFTANEKKLIRSLAKASARKQLGLFVVEGPKAVNECLNRFECELIIGTNDAFLALTPNYYATKAIVLPSSFDFANISSLKHPRPLLAVFKIPPFNGFSSSEGFSVLLDSVQDPGNVGTIIRTADWFGVENVFLSPSCADPFSPKVVQASMGSIAHLGICPLSDSQLATFLEDYNAPIIGTFLEGESIFSTEKALPSLSSKALLVMGNEGNGISPAVAHYVTNRITIPAFGNKTHGESLNVAIAFAITLAQLVEK